MTGELSTVIQSLLDLAGIFAFALTGAILAVHKDFDIFGTVILAEAAGLGGGLFRDLILGVTPVAFTDVGYYLAPVPAALLVFFSTQVQRHENAVAMFDAGALALFSVTGTIKALDYGFSVPAAAMLGVATAAGGGVFSSLLALEIPPILRWDNHLYTLPCLLGASGTALLSIGGALNTATAIGAGLVSFIIRVLALRLGWRTPRSRAWLNQAVQTPSVGESETATRFVAVTTTTRRG